MLDELREIGFNEDVTVSGRVLHVQTEVMGRASPVIKTTVMEGGALRASETQPCPDISNVGQVRELASAQHRECVERVARGEVS